MRTPLTDFSRDFCSALRPLEASVDAVVHELQTDADVALADELLPDLRGRGDQLDVLLRKVDEQQAYLMIFGPLKSGKSTLMNALAASYVSEVTGLPAYPTVVFVAHADTPRYRITRYDGSREELADAEALHTLVDAAHAELAQAVRSAELAGRVVDPASDLPRAIRRIDVDLPAGDLERAEVVLVDTPGLYTRMKFGYDTMTRDFKHAASVAVFVVKADNLFLEQVFTEFTELLDLFSRVFLVLNVDSSRVDLAPHGELVPSLEQREPGRIVRAFEELAMNARLRQAADEGRLCIYPVDLLQAAAARLRGEDATATGFEHLRSDLTRFLESNDYLNAFVSDGLTRAGVLVDELEGLCSRPAVRHLVDRVRELAAERDQARALLGDTRALHELAWDRELIRQQRDLVERLRGRGDAVLQELTRSANELLDGWFASGASVQELIAGPLTTLAAKAASRLHELHLDELRVRLDGGPQGLGLEPEVVERLQRTRLDLIGLGRAVLEELADWPRGRPDEVALLDVSAIPVKRRFGDWILLRGRDKVRQRLLGPDRQPGQRITPALKTRLLGPAARETMRASITRALRDLVSGVHEQLERDLNAPLRDELAQRVRGTLADRLEELEPRVRELVAEVDRQRRVMTHIEGLRSDLHASREALQVVRGLSAPSLRDVEIIPAAPRPHPEEAEQAGDEAPAEAAQEAGPAEEPAVAEEQETSPHGLQG